MFQERLPTLSIRCIKSAEFWQTNFNEFLDDFVVKKARTKIFFNCLLFNCLLCSVLLDSVIVAFCTFFNNDSIREV